MITIMKANEMMPSCAIENCTPVVLAIMKVAVAVPGPPSTRAKVPMNSATSLRESVTSAMAAPTAPPGQPWTSPPLGEENLENVFGRAERCFAEVSALPGPVSIAIAAPIGTWHAGASGTAGGRPGVPARQLVDRTVDPTVRALLACLPGVAFPGFRAARCGRRGRG